MIFLNMMINKVLSLSILKMSLKSWGRNLEAKVNEIVL